MNVKEAYYIACEHEGRIAAKSCLDIGKAYLFSFHGSDVCCNPTAVYKDTGEVKAWVPKKEDVTKWEGINLSEVIQK